MSVLVDTSIWIRFLTNRSPYATAVDALLSRDEVHGHDFVYGELLIEDRSGRKELLTDYADGPGTARASHRVVAFVRERK